MCMISQWAHLTFVNDATQTCRWCFSKEIPGECRVAAALLTDCKERKEGYRLSQGKRVRVKGNHCSNTNYIKTYWRGCLFSCFTSFKSILSSPKSLCGSMQTWVGKWKHVFICEQLCLHFFSLCQLIELKRCVGGLVLKIFFCCPVHKWL